MFRLYRLEGIRVVDPSKAPLATGPKWCRLFPGQTVRFREDFPPEGLRFDLGTFEAFIANWTALGKPELPVDYGHDELGIAAGWISDLRIDAEGNLEALIGWTDRARAAIAAEELAYLSPTFAMESMSPLSGEQVGPTLYGAALLNTPFLHDLPRVEAGRIPQPKRKNHMEFLKRLTALLGMAEGASEDEVASAVEAACKDKTALAAKVDEATKELAAKTEAIELSRPVTARAAALELERDALKADLASAHAERDALKAATFELGKNDLIRASLERGVAAAADRVENALKLARGDLAVAKEIVAMIPGTVKTGAVGQDAAPDAPRGMAALEVLRASAAKISKDENVGYAEALELAMKRDPTTTKAVKEK